MRNYKFLSVFCGENAAKPFLLAIIHNGNVKIIPH